MPNEEVLRTVEESVREGLDDHSIQLTTRANQVEGWDSCARVAKVVAIERTFGIQRSTSEITTVRNDGEFVRPAQAHR